MGREQERVGGAKARGYIFAFADPYDVLGDRRRAPSLCDIDQFCNLIMKRLDANKDKKIQYTEMMAALPKKK